MQFQGKTIIVTGAASGIGKATAERFAAEGGRVVLADRDPDGLSAVAEQLGSGVVIEQFDVADPAHCARVVARAVEVTGRLDVLCNIAGILRLAPLDSFSAEDWNRIIQVNLSGAFFMCQAAMPHLIATKGTIVNLSSAAGLIGVPFNAPYVASKHGVVGLTKALALEFATAGVRINAVCPTGVRTAMLSAPPAPGVDFAMLARSAPWLDGGELCEPSDIADAVAFLASNQARRITGIALPVDGGQTAN